ncbi:alpha-protein kinase 2 [Phycodurus eques]|uniref:alpha-protein kinase 2 n=1 Tax=Phycodurus eques TaxID=693459 RepID=UPI002ACF0168|nr:alpha-protein kinase 2 [Phycodurus eques]
MDLTVNTTDDQRQLPSVLPESQISQDSGYFSLLGGFVDPLEPSLPLPPHLSHGLTSATSEIYTESTLESFRASGLSSGHRQTAYLRSLSDSSETDSSTDLMSDLYIFEKETQDFILSSTSQGIKVDNNHDDSPVTVCDSAKRVTHSNATNKGWLMLESGLEPPAEVTRIIPRGPRSTSPAELWADARQYLDNTDALAASTSSDLSLEEIWVSGYGSDGIGWGRDDTRGWGLPVERWSSVESWASALSDWNVIGTPAQELTAAFSEIGAEIDALTEALADIKPYSETERGMGVQDQPVGQTIQEESIQCGQGCFAFQPQMGDDVQSLGDSPANNQKEQEEIPEDNFVQENPSLVSCGDDMDHLIPVWTPKEDVDLPQLVQFLVTEEDKIILKIVEDADVVEQPAEMTNEQLLGDGVFKVTEDHSAPQPDCLPNQGAELNSGSNDVDCNGFRLSMEDTMKPRVPTFNSGRHALADTLKEPHKESQVRPQGHCPTFIVPVVPLEISSALEYRRSSLEGDQMRVFNDDHARTWTLWPLCDEAATDEGVHKLCKELSNWTVIPEKNHTVLDDLHVSKTAKPNNHAAVSKPKPNPGASVKMPHKSEGKPRCKKDTEHDHSTLAPKKLENSVHLTTSRQKETTINPTSQLEKTMVIETAKVHGKKKKKHHHNATGVKTAAEPTGETENGAKVKGAKGRIEMFEAKTKQAKAHKDAETPEAVDKKQPEALKPSQGEHGPHDTKHINTHSATNDDIVKKRRLSKDKFGKLLDLKPSFSAQMKAAEGQNTNVRALSKKASSEVVKHKPSIPKEEPKVMQPIQAASVGGDPQSLNLWCQFAAVSCEHTITWRQEAALLAEVKRSAGDENRVSLTIPNASHKDLGKYQCCLSSSQGSITLDYLLTYEVLREIVIPPSPNLTFGAVEAGVEAEEVQCSQLLFKEDFLSKQYFGENQPISIVTEKAHFGEGMHRRAFRTRLRRGGVPLLLAGPSCVLKVHNAISDGTKNNDDLVKRNFSLAVEECHVQNTAREYIKEYSAAAKSVDAFGEVPEIIPIYLVHRPSSDIPYATLEEELIGDFVKYSVKDGKEINLMRRDSEAGRKCCTFQHWVYQRTDGNLLVTDIQGVGMKLTDVGIATCKKGYKGFKGNCATSFIDQFKVLHQCNVYCEILGLASLQPKATKKAACSLRSKPQPSAGPKKKTFGPTLKAKS